MGAPNLITGTDGRVSFDKENQNIKLDGKLVNQGFSGSVNLSNDLTHYENYTVSTNISISIIAVPSPIIGGSAEIRMIGDGVHTPTFTAFTKSSSSGDFDPASNAINKVVFYYDGTEAFYSIIVL